MIIWRFGFVLLILKVESDLCENVGEVGCVCEFVSECCGFCLCENYYDVWFFFVLV